MNWIKPTTSPVLNDNEIHLWLVDLANHLEVVPGLRLTLSAEEKARADRLCSPILSQKFVYCRGKLREILSRYLSIAPKDIEFFYAQNGKPCIDSWLRFNVSHSHNWALFAISKEIELGIDIEFKRPVANLEEICERFFLKTEYETILNQSQSLKLQTFFEYWVKKEAYSKMVGGRLFQILISLKNKSFASSRSLNIQGEAIWLHEDYVYALAAQQEIKDVHYLLV